MAETTKNKTSVREELRETYRAEVPLMAPFGIPVSAAGVQDVWDVYIKPNQDANRPQSVEERTLMAILRSAHHGLTRHEEKAQTRAEKNVSLREAMLSASEAMDALASTFAGTEATAELSGE